MEGAVEREKSLLDRDLYAAWHTATFAILGYVGKLKPLPQYLAAKPEKPEKLKNAQLIAGFQSLKGRGFDVQISRNEIN